MDEAHVGRRRVTREVMVESPARRLAATLDRSDLDLRRGDALPSMWHWLFFQNEAMTADLNTDGHAPWGGFVPPPELPRRMFGAGSTEFHRPLVIGAEATQSEEIEDVSEKTSSDGQPLVFVTFRSEFESAGKIALVERRTIVYTTPASASPRRAPAPERDWEWSRVVVPNEALLFRFSALTWNAHRIHYDSAFATGVDGHPALVVQGPLVAILLLDLWSRRGERDIDSFSFRATRPAYVGEALLLEGDPSGDLAALNPRGELVMTAAVGW